MGANTELLDKKNKTHAFLSYKIGQILPYFPSRTTLGFLFTDYVFRKLQHKKQSQESFVAFISYL